MYNATPKKNYATLKKMYLPPCLETLLGCTELVLIAASIQTGHLYQIKVNRSH